MAAESKLPPLLAERSSGQQLFLRFAAPAIFGAVVGVVLGVSAPLYWILQVLAAIGGLLAGIEHQGATAGAIRGAVGGAIYGALILIVHELSGAEAEVERGDIPALLVVVTTVVGAVLGALGAAWRVRRSSPRPG